MADIKEIKIFLASSISEEELKDDREKLGSFCNQLNRQFKERGLFFNLIDCTVYDMSISDGGTQAGLDRDIQESDLIFFLFFTKVGKFTRHEFDVALDAYRKNKKPKIVTFFRYVNSPDDCKEEIRQFKDEIYEKYGHYYNIYNSIDTLKLGMLMQIIMLQLDDGVLTPTVDNGVVKLGDIIVGNTENMAMFSNKYLKRLRDDLKDVSEAYKIYQEEYVKAKQSGREDRELYNTYCELASKKAELEAQIMSAEKAVLNTVEDMYRNTADGVGGKLVTEKLARAYRAFEQGNSLLAKEILNLEEILRDAEHVAKIADLANERMQAHVNELLFRIKILKEQFVTKEIAEEILKIYDIAYGLIEKYNLDRWALHEYAGFLQDQNQYNQAITIAKALKEWNEYALMADTKANLTPLTQAQRAALYNLLGLLYSDTNRLDESEIAYNEALTIYRELAKKNPDAYNSNVAVVLNNLGALYHTTNRFDEAEKAYNESLAIRRELAHKNPDKYKSHVATVLNNLGILYKDANRFDEAEKVYNESLEIRREFAHKNPDRYNSYVATVLNNLGILYCINSRFGEAENAFKEALEIRRELAKKNPDAYNPDVAMILVNLGPLYKDTNRLDEAEVAYKEALEIYRELAHKNPDRYNSYVAGVLNNLGNLFKKIDHLDEAEKAYDEALEIYRELAEQNPDAYNPDMAMILYNLGNLHKKTNRLDEANTAYDEAYEIAKKYRETNYICRRICELIESDDKE